MYVHYKVQHSTCMYTLFVSCCSVLILCFADDDDGDDDGVPATAVPPDQSPEEPDDLGSSVNTGFSPETWIWEILRTK